MSRVFFGCDGLDGLVSVENFRHESGRGMSMLDDSVHRFGYR